MMSKYIPLENFKAIYVVDLCHSLCGVAQRKAIAKGWKNVKVVEADACLFTPPEGEANLVTFSYSLSSECRACHSRVPARNQATQAAQRRSQLPHIPADTVRELTGCLPVLQRSDPAIPRGCGPCRLVPGQGGSVGRGGLLRVKQVRLANAPNVLGAPLLLAVSGAAQLLV